MTVCAFSDLTARLGSVAGPRVAAGATDLADCDALLVRSMPPGTAAVAQGDAPDDFYVIVRGRFDVLVGSSEPSSRAQRDWL